MPLRQLLETLRARHLVCFRLSITSVFLLLFIYPCAETTEAGGQLTMETQDNVSGTFL